MKIVLDVLWSIVIYKNNIDKKNVLEIVKCIVVLLYIGINILRKMGKLEIS